MSRRPALITQADVARAIRAVQAAGLHIYRVIATNRGIEIITDEKTVVSGDNENQAVEPRKAIVL